MEQIRSYFIGIAAIAMAIVMIRLMLHDGVVKKTVTFVSGILLALVVLAPIVNIELDSFAKYLSKLEIEADIRSSGIEIENKALIARIIQEKTEAYILDKAASLDAEVIVSVDIETGDSYPYPYAVTISGGITEVQKSALSGYIESELGIPKERQVFVP